MNKELLLSIETVANEKEVSKEVLFIAMEAALATVTKKRFSQDAKIKVIINRKTGLYSSVRQWKIVADDALENPDTEWTVNIAKEKGYSLLSIGDIVEKPVNSIKFGRIAAMLAKQVITYKVREEEKRLMVKKFKDKIGKIIYGEVIRTTRDFMILDLGSNADGILYRNELLPKENYHLNDKVRVCIIKIDENSKGHQIILSRTHPSMLNALLVLEVPEVAEELMDIVHIVRDPGSRAKVAVKSNDKRIDPVGACIGIRGSRIQAIMNELQGERIDIILWDDDPAQYVINSIAPAKALSIVQDEENQKMEIAVKEEQLSQSIGKNGQNVLLASALTNWKIRIIAESSAEEKQQREFHAKVQKFTCALDVDQDVAKLLIKEGFNTLEEIAYIEEIELLKINDFTKEVVQELQERAQTALISDALSKKKPLDELLSIEDMTEEWAKILSNNGILTMEDLADLASDDLMEIIPISEKQAASIVMKARAPWFERNHQE